MLKEISEDEYNERMGRADFFTFFHTSDWIKMLTASYLFLFLNANSGGPLLWESLISNRLKKRLKIISKKNIRGTSLKYTPFF